LEDRIDHTTEPLIRLNHLVKDYGQHRALNGVSLEINRGITGLLGPNGAGKSTLIKVLLGLVKVSAGGGTVLGLDLAQNGRQIRTHVGYMPEDDCYVAGMSGVEAVRFSACLSGIPRLEGLRRAHEILDFAGIEQERYRDLDTYSTGMRQKIKFAQAIVHDPPLLILDEPTSALDPEEREAMLARIRTLCTRHGKTVIISTHILPDVRQVCDHVIILAGGEVRLSESMDVLMRPGALGVTIHTSGDASRLVELLRRRGYSVRQRDTATFFVEAIDVRDASPIWELAATAEVGVLSMTPVRNSLEQIFMNAVRGHQHADL
jgi:ABC-2 type transport system ATP-binding protein